jgi:dihydroxy-acid dehydratase
MTVRRTNQEIWANLTQGSSIYWKYARVELPAAGFEPDRAAKASAVVTIATAWTNAHRCNNCVRERSR